MTIWLLTLNELLLRLIKIHSNNQTLKAYTVLCIRTPVWTTELENKIQMFSKLYCGWLRKMKNTSLLHFVIRIFICTSIISCLWSETAWMSQPLAKLAMWGRHELVRTGCCCWLMVWRKKKQPTLFQWAWKPHINEEVRWEKKKAKKQEDKKQRKGSTCFHFGLTLRRRLSNANLKTNAHTQ